MALSLLVGPAMRAQADIDTRRVSAKAWEDLFAALADQLVMFCSERQGDLSMVRAVAQARMIALDLRIVGGLYDAVDAERVHALLESAHALLEQRRSTTRLRRLASLDDTEDDRMDVTLPGIPADVFRKYLATVRR